MRPIFDAGLAELVEMDHRVSPEVRLMPTPGHTSGHVSVMIESEGQSTVITGDIAHHPCQMAHPDWATSLDSDTQAPTATRAKMFAEWADQPIPVIGTHHAAPTAGHVQRDGAAFRFEVSPPGARKMIDRLAGVGWYSQTNLECSRAWALGYFLAADRQPEALPIAISNQRSSRHG